MSRQAGALSDLSHMAGEGRSGNDGKPMFPSNLTTAVHAVSEVKAFC